MARWLRGALPRPPFSPSSPPCPPHPSYCGEDFPLSFFFFLAGRRRDGRGAGVCHPPAVAFARCDGVAGGGSCAEGGRRRRWGGGVRARWVAPSARAVFSTSRPRRDGAPPRTRLALPSCRLAVAGSARWVLLAQGPWSHCRSPFFYSRHVACVLVLFACVFVCVCLCLSVCLHVMGR